MQRRWEAGLAVALAVGMFGWGAPDGWAESWSATSGVAVMVGDYGTSETTTITQLSETIKYQTETGELGLTIPYLFRDGNSTIPGESRRARAGAIPEDADGFGDLRLKGLHEWLPETEGRPSVDWTGFVKFPTASEEDGLGTGRFDVGTGPALTKHFGSLITFGGLDLVLRDRPSHSTLKAVRLDYSIGVGHPVTDRLTGYASLEGGTPSSSGADSPHEIVFSGVYQLTDTASMDGYVLAGLTDGSPDYGAGAGVKLRF